jgi:hypothetical protein
MTEEISASQTEENVLQETPNTPAIPEDWRDPEPWDLATTNEFDKIDGRTFPACHVCEWCHCKPVEYHEPNHDRLLCEGCTFKIAPFRPVVTDQSGEAYQLEPLYRENKHRAGFSYEEITLRLVNRVLTILADGIDYRFGYDWEANYTDAQDLRQETPGDIVSLCYEIGFYSLDWDEVRRPDMLNVHLPALTEKLVLRISSDPLLDALLYAARALQSSDPKIARRYAVKALDHAHLFFYLGCSLRLAFDTPESQSTKPQRRKRGGIL